MTQPYTVIYSNTEGVQEYIVVKLETGKVVTTITIGIDNKLSFGLSPEMKIVIGLLKDGKEVNEENYRIRYTDYHDAIGFLAVVREIYKDGTVTGKVFNSLHSSVTITNNIADEFKFVIDGEIYYGYQIPTMIPKLLDNVIYKGIINEADIKPDMVVIDVNRSWYKHSWHTHRELSLKTILKLEAGNEIYVTNNTVLQPYISYSKHIGA